MCVADSSCFGRVEKTWTVSQNAVVIFSPRAARQDEVGLLYAADRAAQCPLQHAVGVVRGLIFQRVKIIDGQTVRLVYGFEGCVAINAEHRVMVRLVYDEIRQLLNLVML